MICPDLIVKNGLIRTMDSRNTVVQALAVLNGRVAATGSDAEMDALAGPNTEVLDLRGRTVVPGFIDAHCHLLSLRGKQLLQVDCSPGKVKTIDDIIEALRREAERTPKGQWILGGSYDYSKLEEKRHPTRHDLDRVSRDHPVHLRSQTCHSGILNTKAFEMCGIDADTPDPPGGKFEREPDGYPRGLCLEEAHFLFVTGMGDENSFVPSYTPDQLVTAIDRACREAAAYGITSIGDALVGPAEILAYQEALKRGILKTRVYMIVLDTWMPLLEKAGFFTGFGGEMLKVGAIKSFADGAIAAHTAWLSEPYGFDATYYGIPTKTPEQMDALVLRAHQAGYQMEIHANGDKAIAMVLDSYEKAQTRHPTGDRRHRIAHCTVVNDELVERIARLGVIPVPFTTYVWEHGEKMPAYGERIEEMFAHRTFLEKEIPVAAGSDNPCGTQDVMTALQAMVTRTSSEGKPQGLSQRITPEEALRVYTVNGAYASFEERDKGSLEPGKLADFAVLSRDPVTADPFSLRETRVLRTVLGGETIFRHPEG